MRHVDISGIDPTLSRKEVRGALYNGCFIRDKDTDGVQLNIKVRLYNGTVKITSKVPQAKRDLDYISEDPVLSNLRRYVNDYPRARNQIFLNHQTLCPV